MENLNEPFISIIVPIYNTEKYLKRCLDSVLNQTFKNIEIIAINDYSPNTEECENIINSYNDVRIIYIKHEINKGTLSARITGSSIAKGEYITYLDSDDELDINTCSEIYNSYKKIEADIIHFSAKAKVNEDSYKNKKEIIKDINYNEWYFSSSRSLINNNFLFEEIIEEKIPHTVWAKAYRNELIKKTLNYIPDTRINNAEDMLHSLIIFYFAKSYISINKKLYYYYINIGESSSNKDSDHITLVKYDNMCNFTLKSVEEFLNFLKLKEIDKIYYSYYMKIYFNQYKFLKNKVKDNNEEYLVILNKYFDKNIINTYLRLNEYNNFNINKYNNLINKLTPYLFLIIINEYYINMKIFGIKINFKTKRCFNEPIIISFSSLLKNIFSINTDNKLNKYIKLFFFKIKL